VAQRAEKADGEAARAFKSLDHPHSVHAPYLTKDEPPVGVVTAPVARTKIPGERATMQGSGQERRFASGLPPHEAEVTVTNRQGQTVTTKKLSSGGMTPDEAALGFPRSCLATHTEARAVRNIPLTQGDTMVIRGKYPPCPPCKGAMSQAARSIGATIRYEWPGGTWKTPK
jgi:hypothetical protein